MNQGISINDFQPGPDGDWLPAFAAAFAALAGCVHATVHIPDGDFGVLRPVVVPNHVSLAMAPAARLFTLPGFAGEAVVIKGEKPENPDGTKHLGWEHHGYSGRIGGGIIDGGKLPIHGVIGRWTRRFVLHDLEIFNCLAGGIRIGEQGWYEKRRHAYATRRQVLNEPPSAARVAPERPTNSQAVHGTAMKANEGGAR